MKFKEFDRTSDKAKFGTVTILHLDDKPKPMPEPEVGKIYHGFDDGKIRLSRLIDWKITERIDLDNDKVSQELLDSIQQEILHYYWLFNSEQTIIFKGYAVKEDGTKDEDAGESYFLRTTDDGWFGAICSYFFCCELDVDNRWYSELINEEEDFD